MLERHAWGHNVRPVHAYECLFKSIILLNKHCIHVPESRIIDSIFSFKKHEQTKVPFSLHGRPNPNFPCQGVKYHWGRH